MMNKVWVIVPSHHQQNILLNQTFKIDFILKSSILVSSDTKCKKKKQIRESKKTKNRFHVRVVPVFVFAR